MYLSKIEIFGFKSFAQNVNLNFDAGITAIVGPNGCGKTNIVDAIRWALGEQRYSTLRSDKMEDVIFNGTRNRKPLGMAEVSLIIENTRGILPTEYSQVTISRRVYRSGESEYLLNRVQCRLKDIVDLFMDTGMGADAYSVIELKMVETILSDRTDERRRLFEEAAGVTKYKHRRKAAYHKLESVQQDLIRVNDIVKEVQKTVNALERQSKRAEQFNEISKNLRATEIDLLEHEYAYLFEKLNPLKERFNETGIAKNNIDAELNEQEELLDKMRIEISQVEKQLIDFQRQAAKLVSQIHKYEEGTIKGNEQINSLQSNIERYEKEKIDLFNQKEWLEGKQVTLRTNIEKFAEAVIVDSVIFEKLNTDFQIVGKQLDEKKELLQGLNNEIISLIHEIVQKNGDRQLLDERIENLNRLIERITEDAAYFENEISESENKVSELTVKDKELHHDFIQTEMELMEVNTRAQQNRSEFEDLQHKELGLKNEIHRITAKIDFSVSLIEGSEGRSSSIKYLLNETEFKKKNYLTVADIVNTDEKYRSAIQTALGEAANYIIVEKESEAFEAASLLEKNEKGKAVFICLDRIPKIRRIRTTHHSPILWADQVVKVKEPYRSLVLFLLDSIAIVDDLKSVPDSLIGIKFVSLSGNVRTSGGVVRGGSRRQDEGSLIGKRDQIAELELDKAKFIAELELLQQQQNEKQKILETLDIKAASEKVKKIEKEMASVEMRIAQIVFEKKRANDSIERSKSEIKRIEAEISELTVEKEKLIPEINQIEQAKAVAETNAAELNKELEQITQRWNDLSKAVNDAEIKMVTLQGNKRNAEAELERDIATVRNTEATLQKRDSEIMQAKEDIERISNELQTVGGQLQELRLQLNEVEKGKTEVEIVYTQKRNAIHNVELKIKDDRRLHDDTIKMYHEYDMKISEINQNIEHVRERARNEFEINIELKPYPEDEWIDFAAKREEVRQMKDRIRMLGAINFAAFDEYNTESERLNFMTQQRDDLIEAERTLLNTIEEINNTAHRKFLTTFELIRENFIKTFKSLFDEGDECDLRLEENEDLLEAGIEIIAKPRGKRPTSIDLLSGGEKTLTAIALLFAIYLVKPSPFCILDEVDAPLDDSNIDRYTRILKKFSDNTQFIVVTHNKRTMEAANALYGITMEEEGVSKIVTVRFNDEDRVLSAAVASGV